MKNYFTCFTILILGFVCLNRVQSQDTVKVDFTGMTPHLSQTLYLRVVDLADNSEVGRTSVVISTAAFSISVPGITAGGSYHVDFFADHNKNGKYDSPPVDHAWRSVINNAMGNTTIAFAHNTSFTQIEWPHALTIAFSNMTPHVGQDLYLALVDKTMGVELDRKKMVITQANFDVTFTGLTPGNSYDVDFFADHNHDGLYNAPPTDHTWRLSVDTVKGDTTVPFVHNTNFTDIHWSYGLTVAFTNMTPHIGQDLYLALMDKTMGVELDRKKMVITQANFDVTFTGLTPGNSYDVDFFADHNHDGLYNAPPTDHTWRLSVDTVKGDTTVPFVHNTNFTDIHWSYGLTVAFSNMTPHVGQDLYLALKDKTMGVEVERKKVEITQPDFKVTFTGIIPGNSYDVDFFADHNQNGTYNAPPADHAWRLSVDTVKGDTTVPFVHNTNFTDIGWTNKITIAFSNMNPHLGQNLYFSLKDKADGIEKERRKMLITSADFDVTFSDITPGSYDIDFFADHNKNGKYDMPPADHAWRITVNDVNGDTTVDFVHNTSFTDIMWSHALTLAFSNMTPHVGQDLYLALIDKTMGMEIERKKMVIATADFDVSFMGITPGHSYNIDFWADHSMNGAYDAPPVDHAWRISVDTVKGDTTVLFVHNTSFTDVEWKFILTVHFTGMTPHVGQLLKLYLRDMTTSGIIDSVVVDPVDTADFSVQSWKITPGNDYNVDFYADLNGNDMYDAPPTDHAWRIPLMDVQGDTIITFAHNTNFTDIFPGNPVDGIDVDRKQPEISLYPNPAGDNLYFYFYRPVETQQTIQLFSSSGRLIKNQVINLTGNSSVIDVSELQPGIYILNISDGKATNTMKFIKK